MEILESRKAFALYRYQEGDVFNKKGLERDTQALVVESSGEIHSFFLAVLPDGSVVNPSISKTKDVAGFYAADSPQTRKEKDAGLQIRQSLLDEPENTVVAWISPPEGEFDYKEGRFEIGRVRTLLGIKVLQSYGIPLKDIKPEYCERLFLMLEEFSAKPPHNINSPEDLRDKIISFIPPNNSNWLNFLKEVFPELSEIITKIQTGEVLHIHLKALKDAKAEVSKAFKGEKTPKGNLIYIGAQIERGMERRGWNLSGGTCGYLNSDLLSLQNKGMFGMVKMTSSERRGKYVKKCPFCRAKIEKIIEPGYVCQGNKETGKSCGKTFEGIC